MNIHTNRNLRDFRPFSHPKQLLATYAAAKQSGPCYLRLVKTGDPIVHEAVPNFQIGKAVTVRNGSDITLVASGGILYNTMQAAKQLEQREIDARVLSMHTVKPLDTEAVLKATRETNAIITIEEHNIIGGLGSAVAAVLAESANSRIAFKRIGIKDSFCSQVGSQEYLRNAYSLSVESIVSEAIQLLKGMSKSRLA